MNRQPSSSSFGVTIVNSTSIHLPRNIKNVMVQHSIALQFGKLKSSKKAQQTLFKDDIDHLLNIVK